MKHVREKSPCMVLQRFWARLKGKLRLNQNKQGATISNQFQMPISGWLHILIVLCCVIAYSADIWTIHCIGYGYINLNWIKSLTLLIQSDNERNDWNFLKTRLFNCSWTSNLLYLIDGKLFGVYRTYLIYKYVVCRIFAIFMTRSFTLVLICLNWA